MKPNKIILSIFILMLFTSIAVAQVEEIKTEFGKPSEEIGIPKEKTPPKITKILDSEAYYYYAGGKVQLDLSLNEFAIQFHKNLTNIEIEELLKNYLDQNYWYAKVYKDIFLFQLENPVEEKKEIERLVDSLNQDPNVEFANLVYYSDGHKTLVSNLFVVKSKVGKDTLEEFNKKNNIEFIRNLYETEDEFILKVNQKLGNTALAMSNLYYNSGLVDWAEPDFIVERDLNKVGSQRVVSEEVSKEFPIYGYYLIGILAILLIVLLLYFLKKKR